MQIASPGFCKRVCLCSDAGMVQHGLAVLIATSEVMKSSKIINANENGVQTRKLFFQQSISKYSKKGSIAFFNRWRNSGTEQ